MKKIYLKNVSFILVLLLNALSCKKQDEIIICEGGTEGVLLDRIEYKDDKDTLVKKYFYDSTNRLDSIQDEQNSPKYAYKFKYSLQKN